jgi:hypothetical protein
VTRGVVAAREREGEQKGVEGLQGRRAIRKVAVDLALVQKAVLAPDEAPLQTVGHTGSPPQTRVRPSSIIVNGTELREAELYAHACRSVGAAAVLRAHGQDGYLDECI